MAVWFFVTASQMRHRKTRGGSDVQKALPSALEGLLQERSPRERESRAIVGEVSFQAETHPRVFFFLCPDSGFALRLLQMQPSSPKWQIFVMVVLVFFFSCGYFSPSGEGMFPSS